MIVDEVKDVEGRWWDYADESKVELEIMSENPLKTKSYAFAWRRIDKLYQCAWVYSIVDTRKLVVQSSNRQSMFFDKLRSRHYTAIML
jgi:hypothetical protein